MFATHALTLPESILLPDADGPDAYSRVEHLAVDVATDGDRYVLTRIRQLSPGRTHATAAQLLSRHRPDGTLVGRLVLSRQEGLPRQETRIGIEGWPNDLSVLPDGTVALSSPEGRTYLVDEGLKSVHLESPFSQVIRVTPAGRLLCVAPKSSLGTGVRANLIGLTEEALTAEHRPTLRIFKALRVPGEGSSLEHGASDTENASTVPYTEYRGAPAGPGNLPAPGLISEVEGRATGSLRFLSTRRFDPHHEAFRVVAEDRFVVPLFESFRPNRWSGYSYALVDDTGTLVGELESPGLDDTSPVPGEQHAVVTDPARGRVYHVNRSGLYVWDADGRLLLTLPTTDKAHRGLKQLKLMACAPDGSLVLIRQEHNLLLNVDVPDDLDGIGSAIAEALADHTRVRTRLKRLRKPVDWRWIDDEGTTVHLR